MKKFLLFLSLITINNSYCLRFFNATSKQMYYPFGYGIALLFEGGIKEQNYKFLKEYFASAHEPVFHPYYFGTEIKFSIFGTGTATWCLSNEENYISKYTEAFLNDTDTIYFLSLKGNNDKLVLKLYSVNPDIKYTYEEEIIINRDRMEEELFKKQSEESLKLGPAIINSDCTIL